MIQFIYIFVFKLELDAILYDFIKKIRRLYYLVKTVTLF